MESVFARGFTSILLLIALPILQNYYNTSAEMISYLQEESDDLLLFEAELEPDLRWSLI